MVVHSTPGAPVEDPKDKQTEGPSGAGWEAEFGRLEILEPSRVRIWRDALRRLHVEVDGKTEHVDVSPARAFPVSEAADYISFLDGSDREVVLLRNPDGLDPESRSVLVEALDRAYFVPKIVQIYEIEESHGAARWWVETDRGERIFDVRDREDVRVIRGRRVVLQDIDGNRFEIENMAELDLASRKLLDKEI